MSNELLTFYRLDLQLEAKGVVLPSLTGVITIDLVSCIMHLQNPKACGTP